MSRSDLLSPKSLVLVAGLFAAGACATLQTSSAETTSAETTSAIVAERSAFWDAHEEGNSTKLAAFFAKDGVFWPQGARAFNGPEDIGKAAKGLFAVLAVTDFKIESQDLQVYGPVVYELTTFSQILTPKGGQPNPARGRYLIVWKQGADDRWRIHLFMTHFISGGR
jgi:uncharacterized protein (TIGR02246 family)